MKKRIYKKWLKNPLNKRLVWKFCKPINKIPIAYVYKENGVIKSKIIYKKI